MPTFNTELSEKEYVEGEEVWWVPGFSGHWLLAIKCKITYVDDFARKKHPMGRLFYWLDEPVGHAVPSDELFDCKEDAIEYLNEVQLEHVRDMRSDFQTGLKPCTADLQEYRTASLNGIRESWVRAGHGNEWARPTYPNKEKGKEWYAGVFYHI